MPPLKKERHIACNCRSVGRYVGVSVSLNLMQLITQEWFIPQASNLVGRWSLITRWPNMDIQVSRSKVKVKGHASLLHIVQLLTQEGLAPRASKFVSCQSLMSR